MTSNRVLGLAVSFALISGILSPYPRAAASSFEKSNKAAEKAYEQGNFQAAAEHFAQAVKEASRFEEVDKRRATTTYNYALALQMLERYDEAKEQLKQALSLIEKAYGPTHERNAEVLSHLGDLCVETGKLEEAADWYQKTVDAREKAVPADSAGLSEALKKLADLYAENEQYSKAEPLYKRRLSITRKVAPESEQLTKELAFLGEFYCVQGKFDTGEPYFKEAAALAETTFGPDSAQTARILNNYGGLYYDQGKYAEAEPLFRRSLSIAQKNTPSGSTDISLNMMSLADVLDMQGKVEEADKLYNSAIESLEKQGDIAGLITCLKNYTKHLSMSNRHDEVQKVRDRLKELRAKAREAAQADD